jgi:hypothetical protein
VHPEQYNRGEQTQERKRDRKCDHLTMQEVVVVPVHLHAYAPVADQMVGAGKTAAWLIVAPGSARIEIDKKEPTRTASRAAFQ